MERKAASQTKPHVVHHRSDTKSEHVSAFPMTSFPNVKYALHLSPTLRGALGCVVSSPCLMLPTTTHATLTGHDAPVLCVRFNKDGKYLLTTSKDRTWKLWNPRSGVCIKTYSGHAHPVNTIDGANDNSRVATAGGDKDVFLWDVTSGQKLRKFKGHEGGVNGVRFTGEGDSVIVTAGFDRSIKFWDGRSNSNVAIQSVTAFNDSVMSIDVKDTRILAGSIDGKVKVFDVRTGKCFTDDFGSERSVTSTSFSGDGKCALIGTLGSRLCLIDLDEGDILAEYRGRTSETSKNDSKLTHDDAFVVSGSEDGKVFVWELVDAKVEAEIDAHPNHECNAVDTHPSLSVMVTGGTDGVVRVWVPKGGGERNKKG